MGRARRRRGRSHYHPRIGDDSIKTLDGSTDLGPGKDSCRNCPMSH